MSKKENIIPRNADGKKHGLCIYYHDNGNVLSKERFVNGKRHGICEYYFKNGELLYKRYWLNGKLVYRELYADINGIKFDI